MEIKDFCTGIQHIGIPTNDIKATIAFYEQLGFQVVFQTINQGESVAFLQLGNLVIETYESKSAVMQAGAIDHIALDVKDIDTLYEVMKDKHFSSAGQSGELSPVLGTWSKVLHYTRAKQGKNRIL